MSQVENFSLGLEQIVVIVKLHVLVIDSTILVTLLGTVVIFSTPPPPNVGFCELASQKYKIQRWEGRSTTFSWNMGTARGVPT